MPTAIWDDGGWFEVYDHDTDSVRNNLIDCLDGNCAASVSERFGPDCT
ncbi:MAG: hypothetical protein JHC81_01430 [Brevundimonas sp.]|nr:hypothetical protein [Brevundimonas sp.]MBJ7446169.1 hypothetical protein [Brevundimonas sp.]